MYLLEPSKAKVGKINIFISFVKNIYHFYVSNMVHFLFMKKLFQQNWNN